MALDRKMFAAGAVLVLAVPLLLWRQSANSSAGTNRGFSDYNKDQVCGTLTDYLFSGEPRALNQLLDYSLLRDGNPVLSETWIKYIERLCGPVYEVRLARGRVLAYRGNQPAARREIAAAVASAATDEEREKAYSFLRELEL